MIKKPGFTRKRSGDQRGRFKAPKRSVFFSQDVQEPGRVLSYKERALRTELKKLLARNALRELQQRTFLFRPPFPFAEQNGLTRDDVVQQGRPLYEADGLELYL